ncbi:MAG TPA: hypothetical protein VF743_06215 [Acidimicrobiales bacterium]
MRGGTGTELKGRADDVLPPRLARELQAGDVRPLRPGASPARVWRVATPRGPLAVKVLRRGSGMVDGHDIDSFLQEPAQIHRIHRELPELSSFYVHVVGVWRHTDWAAYAMPFVEGSAAVSPAEPRGEALERLDHVFRVLTEHGYARTRRHAPDGRGDDLHVGRIRRRLWVLQRRLPGELVDGGRLLVNGRSCRPLGPLLQEVERSAALARVLRPNLVSYPVHGDLDLGDVLVHPGHPRSFTLIDPGGTQSYRDPTHDFAKALFGLTVLDRSLASGLRIWRLPPRPGRPASYIIRAVDAYRGYPALGRAFVDVLAALPFGAELERVDPYWRVRLAFAHGFHALAEAARRVVDRRPTDVGAAGRSPLTLATGFCALGLRLIEQAIDGTSSPGTLPDVSTGLDDDARAVWRV